MYKLAGFLSKQIVVKWDKKYIKKSMVEWDGDGVTFIEATGHKQFIPKKMFIGGREDVDGVPAYCRSVSRTMPRNNSNGTGA